MAQILDGKKLREDEYFIMEIKSNLTMPFWLARLLSDHKIYKSSFSKYKEAYILHFSIKANSLAAPI